MGTVGKCCRAAAEQQPATRETVVNSSKSSGPCRSRHGRQRHKTSFPHVPSPPDESISSCSPGGPQRVLNPCTYPVRGGLARKRNHHQPKHPHPGVLEQDIPRSQERWQTKTGPGSINSESLLEDSKFENGASRKNPDISLAVNVGYKPGHNGCFPSSHDKQGFPEVFLLSLQRRHLHVPSHAVWLDNGTLGFFKTYETHQKLSKEMGSHSQFVHRRLFKPGFNERPSKTAHFLDQVRSDLAWFQHQREEVPADSHPGYRISGCRDKFQGVDHGTPDREGGQNSLIDSSVNWFSVSHQKGARISGWTPFVWPQNDATRQNAHQQGHCLAESIHQGVFKRHPCESEPQPASGTCPFQTPVPAGISPILPPPCPLPDYHDGRLQLWLVGGPNTFQGQRCLDFYGKFILHKCSRVNRDPQDDILFRGFPPEHYGQNPHRQHGHFVLSKEDGFISLSSNEQCVQGFSFIVSQAQYPICGRSHQRPPERFSRQGFSSGPYKHRENVGPGLITLVMEPVAIKSMARRLCFTGNFEMSFLRFSLPGSQSLRHRCISPRLERLDHTRREHVFFPASCLYADAGAEVCGFQRTWGPDSSLQWSFLAFSAYATSSPSTTSPKGLLPIPVGTGQFSHSQKESRETSCVSPVAQGLVPQLVEPSAVSSITIQPSSHQASLPVHESSTLTSTFIDSPQVFPSGSNSVANQFVSIPVNGNVVRKGTLTLIVSALQ